jgi:ribosomal protein S12 methylthiotransferase
MKKVGMVSLGCPKNTVDSEGLLGDLKRNGFEITSEEEADVVIVNTCGFIDPAKRESIDTILEMAKLKTDGNCQKLVVTGCLAERYSEELVKEIPEIDLMLGVNQYPSLKNLLGNSNNENKDLPEKNLVEAPHEHYESYGDRLLSTPFYSAYVKIAEGCSNKCAFCIIPKMRGPFRSRPMESIVDEVSQLAQKGVKEFSLISQDTTMFGTDLRMKNGLAQLLESLNGVEGAEWFRLMYCYPTFVNPELINAVARLDKVCNYMDIPLQHTHDYMLKRMRRQETEKIVRNMMDDLRNKIPDIALRTTFIVGFPGETDEHFNHMLQLMKDVEFDHVGCFTYFNEEGTQAYDYLDQVPHSVAEERKVELMQVQQEISQKKNEARLDRVYPVLIEGVDEDEGFLLTGRLPSQAPEIDGQVIIDNAAVQPGEIVPLKITGFLEYDLVASGQD